MAIVDAAPGAVFFGRAIMPKSVDDLIGDVLEREGGYVNHPSDRGGPTNYGITRATLAEWLGRPVSIEDVKSLDKETARAIYRVRYFAGPRINRLPAGLQPVVFDGAVNHGPAMAVRLLQRAINKAGVGRVAVDGDIGPRTIAAAAEAWSFKGAGLVALVADQRETLYRRLAFRSPNQRVFLDGWLARIAPFRTSESLVQHQGDTKCL